jgi:hypothetical protein
MIAHPEPVPMRLNRWAPGPYGVGKGAVKIK